MKHIKSTLSQKAARRLAKAGIALALLLTVGCGTLDIANPNAPIVEDATIQSLVTGTEAGMRLEMGIYLRVVGILGREVYYFEPADPRYTGELLFGTVDPGGFLLNRPWSARYRTIANCNFLLEKAQALSGEEKAGVEGFAKTVIAYQLLLNLNYLDENGIKLDFTGDLDAGFASKADAFATIETLLDEAHASLGSAGAAFPFKLTDGFADGGFDTPAGFAKFNRAIRARVAVYQGKYNDALTALGASFVDPGASLDLGVYHLYGTGLGDQTNPIFENPDAPFVKLMAHPTFAADAEAGDARFSNKVRVRAEATTFDNLTSNLGVTLATSSTSPLPVIRNEELLLLRAEANIGLGNYAAAEADINVVRAAAGLGNVTLTADNALTQLLHEKRYSLFGEGHRWIDMRRYGKLGELPIDRPATDNIIDKLPRPETEIKEGG